MTDLQTLRPLPPRVRPTARRRRAVVTRRRRSRWHAPRTRIQLPALGRRLGDLRLYAAAAVLAALILVYLVQAAQVTAASYRIESLQAQQQSLLADRAQLRYEEASLQAPARVQAEASQTGMQRAAPAGYLAFRSVGVNLLAPVDAPPAGTQPFWTRIVAALWPPAAQ